MDLDKWIETLKRCELLTEPEVKLMCLMAIEILVEESNVQRVDAPVTICEPAWLLSRLPPLGVHLRCPPPCCQSRLLPCSVCVQGMGVCCIIATDVCACSFGAGGDIHGQFYDLCELFKVGGDCPKVRLDFYLGTWGCMWVSAVHCVKEMPLEAFCLLFFVHHYCRGGGAA